MKELAKTYAPKEFEDRIYDKWVESHSFHAEINPDKTPFTIVMPPPNVTGQLHIGHALDGTLQDIITRFKRMKGFSALWLPGTDHAALATEVKIVAQLRSEGTSKEALGREKYLERAWQWKEEYAGRIIGQFKKLGASCDWDRLRFTMDEGCNKAVKEFFVHLYDKGLIYRGKRMINWCVNCKTSLSDAEVVHEDKEGYFWHIRYQIKGTDDYIEIATTRPETMLADTAVAVNPNDPRYTHLIGKTVILPLVGREIPVVADDYVKTDFGTGIVKITPAHDPNDYEVGLRHNLRVISMMTDDGKITAEYTDYAGMDRYEARKKIVADLEKGGYLIKTESHDHAVGTCDRCGSIIEPKVSTQWFVKMKTLAEPAIEAVKSGETKFVPKRFEKIYFHWLENITDWCISRQIWWGHRIPAFYCDTCGDTIVSREENVICPKCGKKCRQDEDTLDTWFSSALWPFSTLGWPDKTPDFEYFYPTNTLCTGYDIILFWVMRMMFSGIETTGKAPFDTVLIHGLVRDGLGRKMSKSLGNGLDPLMMIDKYGADALRFMLVSGNAAGSDINCDEDKILAARNFVNKLWNASRFVFMNLPESFVFEGLPSRLAVEDKWVISRLNAAVKSITENIENYEMGIAAANLTEFIRGVYCDWYIEIAKPRLLSEDKEDGDNVRQVLMYVLRTILKLLHPFMPYVTECIWESCADGLLIAETFPEYDEKLNFPEDETEFEKIISGIKAVRNKRTELDVPPSRKAKIFIETAQKATFESGTAFFKKLAFASEVEIGDSFDAAGCVIALTADARLLIPLSDIVDFKKEIERLNKEKAAVQKDIEFLSKKLSNPGFLAKAPANQVEAEKVKLAAANDKMGKIQDSLKTLE
ncbi:MAG: valine--tRNA ligase [Ruminococcus sp.]|nr:valine--tRNA ligase [Ruminococcus sp.]